MNDQEAAIDLSIKIDDELYLYIDNDEMCLKLDGELFSTYVIEGLEIELEISLYLFCYELNTDMEVEHESNSNVESDLMGLCLNAVEFYIHEGEKFRLLKGMIFPDIDIFRKVLYECKIQYGFLLLKIRMSSVESHLYGNKGFDWKAHASTILDGVTFMIKTCTPYHTCVMSEKINATAK